MEEESEEYIEVEEAQEEESGDDFDYGASLDPEFGKRSKKSPTSKNRKVSSGSTRKRQETYSSNDGPRMPVEELAQALSEKLKSPIDSFVESIEGVQEQIPIIVQRGIAKVLTVIQDDIKNMIEARVNVIINEYSAELKAQQRKFGFKVYGFIIGLTTLSLVVVGGGGYLMMPSPSEIAKQRDVLERLKQRIAETPYEVDYLGKKYVRIQPGTEIMLRGHDGDHTYAIPESPASPQR